MPRIGIDYHFMRDEGDEDQVPLITMVDSKTKAVWQRVVEEKGVGDKSAWIVRAMADELDDC